MLAGNSRRLLIRACSPQFNSKLLMATTKQTTEGGDNKNDASMQSYHKQLDALKVSSNAWTKSTFGEFAEKMILHRFEYLLEKTSYMEELRKSQKRMLEIQKNLYENAEKRRTIIKKLNDLMSDNGNQGNQLPTTKVLNIASQKQLWHEYNKLEQEELSLATRSVLAINETYEAEKLHTKLMRSFGILLTIASSLLTLVLSYLIRREPQQQHQYAHIMAGKNQSNAESWTSYLHRNTKWAYSWVDRFR
ncbi:uncharacterized protein LOC101892508 [Musca domestica]|uniref:Uncharacterized protein LOC101892508 n=1 Tax=Musca domestica TaxID=7370 RepID=A0A1I8MI38_MUSDO|nr:uncharacterized protein LOC101892508 [Musca domestica]